MKQLPDRLIDSLRTLGLTEYEARVYSSLTLMGHADAKQVYEYLGASKPNVYESLKSLVSRGFVIVVSAKPALYKAVPYDQVLNHLIETHQQAEESARADLEELERHSGQEPLTDVLWTLFGERNIDHKLEAMLSGAKQSVRGMLLKDDLSPLEYLRGKDLRIDLLVKARPDDITGSFDLKSARLRQIVRTGDFRSDDEDFIEFHRIMLADVVMFIVDDREFIYILPAGSEQQSGITSTNPDLVRMAGLIFNMAWRRCG